MFFNLVIYPLTQIIELVYQFCYKLFNHNTPVALIGVSCAVSLLTLPLYIVAEHWAQVERDKQSAMKNQINKIKAVFKGNEQYMILSTYYRQQHYHPIMGLRSAFGLLIQIPFFTAAYACLSNMTALNTKGILWIENWSQPDNFTILGITVHLLPIIMTVINLISSTIYTKGFSIKERLYPYGLALLFVFILYNSPSGLVLYWTMNNLFSLVKNIFYKMKNPVKVLYILACSFVTIFILWILAGHRLSLKRGLLVSCCFGLIYFAPLFVKLANHLIDKTFVTLKDSFKLRTSLFFTAVAGLTVLMGLFLPSNLISASPTEFCGIDTIGNPNFFINNTFFQTSGIFLIWCSLIYFLYHERMQTLISFGLTSLLGASLLGVFVFKGDYGTISKLLRFVEVSNVDSSLAAILINGISILAVIAVIALLIKLKLVRYVSYGAGIVAFSLFAISFYNKSIITKGYEHFISTGSNANQINPFIHLSKTGKNVLFIYLDRAENTYVEPLFEEDKNLHSQFSGFTLFKNTVSFNGHTLLGAPSVYGGYEYTPENMNKRSDVKLVDKQNECLLVLPRIFTESGKNYTAVVTDPTWENYEIRPNLSTIYKKDSEGKNSEIYPGVSGYITDSKYTDYWYKEHSDTASIPVTSKTLKRNLLWFSFFRCAPLALRPAFYNDGSYWSTDKESDDFNDYIDGYAALDYLPQFTDTEALSENVYISFTNNTTHDGLFLKTPEYVPSSHINQNAKKADGVFDYANDRSYHSFAGAMKRVGEYFDYLKKLGVYDNSRIVIVADHGCSSFETDFAGEDGKMDEKFSKIGPGKFHPLLMFKDFNQTKTELTIDRTTFMTNADTPLLLLNGNSSKAEKLIQNPVNPFTGKPLAAEKENGALICTSDRMFMPNHSSSSYVFTVKDNQWIRVKDNIFDSSNWNYETVEAK